MVLKKLFKFGKDFKYYLEKGERCFADERYADARLAFCEALERIEGDAVPGPEVVAAIRDKIREAGNRLGEINLAESEHALRGGDMRRAQDHLRIVLDLADDPVLRTKAQQLLASLDEGGEEKPVAAKSGGSCNDCSGGHVHEDSPHHDTDDSMLSEDRVALYFHSLPGDLPERYADMGAEFSRGCLLNLEGDGRGALGIFEKLSGENDNDILDYEKAIIYYHAGDSRRCESMLKRALERNVDNPLCYIALVHLYTDGGRAAEAVPLLKGMVARGVIADQGTLMLGDIYGLLGDAAAAAEQYALLINSPLGREAAERLIPILEYQGKSQEAAFLAKKFSKKCS